MGDRPQMPVVPDMLIPPAARREPGRTVALALFTDGSWRRCTVVCWASRQSGWAVRLRWPNGGETWHEYSGQHLKPV